MEYVAESSQSRRKRGPTKCKEIQSLPNDLTIPIKVNGLKQPVCPNSVLLQSYLGTISKNGDLCPIDYVDWRLVPKTLKERIYQLVESKFSFSMSRKEMERLIGQSVGKKWREYKGWLRREFLKEKKTEEEYARKVPNNVDPLQWQHFVSFYMTPKGKNLLSRGKRNRACQRLLHTTGRKSYARLRNEMQEKTQSLVGPLQFFEATHMRKSGGIDDEASCILETVKKKVTEKIGESDCSTNELFNLEQEAFLETFGKEHPGRVRMFAFGATPSQVYGSCRTSSQAENLEVQELKRKIEQMTQVDEERDRKTKQMEEEIKESNRRTRQMEREIKKSNRSRKKMKKEIKESNRSRKKMEEELNELRQLILSSQVQKR